MLYAKISLELQQPSFAEFIAIYRKFERLSVRNLLYLQSELHDLEGQL
jgi:hypothetical protein